MLFGKPGFAYLARIQGRESCLGGVEAGCEVGGDGDEAVIGEGMDEITCEKSWQ